MLSAIEARALGVLIEKQRTVPDTYPLSLNSLVAGCNQKSSRNPLMEASEAEVQAAVDSLKRMNLAIESSGGRVARYAHNMERVLQIPDHTAGLLAVLMLRGPQTVGEMRINGERLHKLSDIAAVDAILHELAERTAGALVTQLPRQPGSREIRWAHLLCGTPSVEDTAPAPAMSQSPGHGSSNDLTELRADVARLEAEVGELKALVTQLSEEIKTLRETGSQ